MNLGFEKIRVYHDTNAGSESPRFVIEPCEIGFGTTLGNSLRRALLSSMPGAAVIGFKAEGVIHEFMTIPGAATDTVEFVTALKELRFKVVGEELHTIKLTAKKAGIYKASDLVLPEGVTLLTPDIELINALGKNDLDIEIYIRNGRGFVLAKDHTEFEADSGVIKVDGKFTPIKRVSYNVNPFRVGNNINYEQLVLEVHTDGSIEPIHAIGIAAKIAKTHFDFFEDIKDIVEKTEIYQEKKEEENFVLNKQIAELELSVRSANGLKIAKIETLGQLVNLSETELGSLKNLGEKSVTEIKEKLVEFNLKLRND